MQKFIRILMLLAVTVLAGSGVWAQDDPGNGEGNPLGVIYYDDQDATVTTAGGMLEFFNNDACDFDSEGNYQISANENVPAEWLDAERTVYIKATPNAGHKLGAADAETHAVTFITATETVAMSGGNNARTRADGDAIAVTLVRTDGQAGIYKFQMPAAVNGIASDVTVTAAFPEHTVAKLGDTGYGHITFIDYKPDAQTGTLTAVSRSTEDLKDANNQPVPVYVLDGTETTLGTAGTSESPTEAWYVCLTPPTANNGKGLVYDKDTDNDGVELRLANYCHVHLILADGSLMNVVGESSVRGIVGSNFTIYGQGGTDGAGQSAEGVFNVSSLYEAMTIYGDLTINGGQVNAASPNSKTIDVEGGDIAIHGGIVKASSDKAIAIYAEDGDIAITGGSVICTAGYIECSYNGSGGNLTISGGEMNVSSARSGIQCFKSFSISDGQVEAYVISSVEDLTISGGVVKLISDGYGIISEAGNVVISGGQVETPLIKATNDITLGWTAASDYIKAGSFTATSGKVKTAGKRFVALDESAGEGLPTAKAIVPADATAGSGFALSDIAGQTLRPVDGYLLGLCPGLGLKTVFRSSDDYNLESDPGTLEFTMAGDKTTHYYIYKKNDLLVLSVGVVNDGFNGTDYNSAHVEILQENPTDPTAMPTACTEFSEDAHTMNMPAEDLKIVAYRAYMTGVKYLEDGSAKNYSSVEKAYILDGHDHTLYGGKGVWYILLAKANDTSGWMNDGQGNWMLTAGGNMFECRGNVNIVLADGSALCVGTKDYPFTGGGAVITGVDELNFYTQSVPTETDGDKRGRMKIYTDGAKAFEAGYLTLRNIKLKAQGSPGSDGLVTANNNIRIIGGQIDVNAGNANSYAFYTNGWIVLDWNLSFDEIFGSKYFADYVKIADGKTFVDKSDKSEKISGTIDYSDIDGYRLDGKTLVGQVIYDLTRGGSSGGGGGAGGGAGGGGGGGTTVVDTGVTSGSGGPMVVDDDGVKTAALVALSPAGGAVLVSTEGSVGITTTTGNIISGTGVTFLSPVENFTNTIEGKLLTEDRDEITLQARLIADGSFNADELIALITDATVSGGGSGAGAGSAAMMSTELTASGTGADADLKAQGDLAGAIYDAVSTKMIAAGDGSSTVGQITQASLEDEISRIQVQLNYVRQLLSQTPQGDAMYNSYLNLINFYEEKISQLQVTLHTSTALDPSLGIGGKQNISIAFGTKVTGDHSGALGDSRTRAAGDETRLTLAFVPVDDDPDDVLPEGEIRLFMTQAELLSIAIYQREHPDEVAQARARGALMIDTTTPETTAIIGRLMVTERAQPVDGHWYGLDGRRLPSAPTAKGVYVHRGRKVVIR